MIELGTAAANPTKQVEYLGNIRVASGRLIQLTDEILDLAKIEAIELYLNYLSINVNEAVSGCLALEKPMADSRNVQLEDKTNDGFILTTIADTGIGIPKDEYDNMFICFTV